ncbi:helix-turn-helix domain-containing protein [Oryzicola mucosus]|uniref:Helix-turn-helix transcriptional regulator n=1 Tax=Oryzicola mucosus TaxID=2767425 RepID=A0A8J6Q541_9HYPH|nr:helix-turn-helix transcriptional regulator [Oryzicola mucosus]MBD0416825.1 helix-turn-helix transcriptional regulator [Oryzicola mucosus]
MNLRTAFGINLQRIRRQRGLSQEQLAARAGLARAYLSGAEAGRRNPTLDTIEAFAQVLEVDAAELLLKPSSGASELTS